jgi:hypothetical protein
MQIATWFRRAGWLGVFGMAALATGAVRADDDQPADEKSPKAEAAAAAKEALRQFKGRSHVAKYWLQMQVVSVPHALGEQLDLKGEGVLVAHVRPEGPADKGGIKENDVLLTMGDKPLKDLTDVVQALNASEGKELSIKLMRAGKTMTVTATPVERTKGDWDSSGHPYHPFGDVDLRDMEIAIREKLKGAGVDMRMQFIQPGKIFPHGADLKIPHVNFLRPAFPDDLSVTLHKQGGKPADIEVKRGDKSWNVKEDDLAALPDDVRPHIEGLLGRDERNFNLRLAIPFTAPRPPGPPRAEGPGPDGPGPGARPPRPNDGPDHGPGDRRPGDRRPPRPDGPDHRPPGPPRAEGGPPDGPGEHPARPRGAGRGPGRPDGPGPAGRAEERLERRLEEMNRRMQEIHREFEGLRRSLHDRNRDRDEQEEEVEFDDGSV